MIRIAGESSKLITVRSTRHGPLLSDVSAELSSVGANAEVGCGRAAAGERVRRRPGVDGAHAAADGRRDLRVQRGLELDGVPRGGLEVRRTQPEPRVRRHRRQHRLPGTRRHPHPQGQPQRRLPGGRVAAGERLDRPLRAVRPAAERAQPARGLPRHGQPGRHRTGLPVLPQRLPGPRLPQPAHPQRAHPPDRGRLAPRRQRHDPAAARRPQPDGSRPGALPDAAADDLGVLRRRPAAAARLGLHPAGGLGGRRLLQRGLEQRAAADLPRPAARAAVARRRPALDGGGEQPAAPARQPVVGRRRPPRASSRTAT